MDHHGELHTAKQLVTGAIETGQCRQMNGTVAPAELDTGANRTGQRRQPTGHPVLSIVGEFKQQASLVADLKVDPDRQLRIAVDGAGSEIQARSVFVEDGHLPDGRLRSATERGRTAAGQQLAQQPAAPSHARQLPDRRIQGHAGELDLYAEATEVPAGADRGLAFADRAVSAESSGFVWPDDTVLPAFGAEA